MKRVEKSAEENQGTRVYTIIFEGDFSRKYDTLRLRDCKHNVIQNLVTIFRKCYIRRNYPLFAKLDMRYNN